MTPLICTQFLSILGIIFLVSIIVTVIFVTFAILRAEDVPDDIVAHDSAHAQEQRMKYNIK